ncbi:LPS-assembly protein LptD [Oleiharenicola sp. Vm1]|uniref:LPS-assembly protein LptD n=1 Tax=Oleiharenicola sp. Vm1 TaxID=3398393 RepID=UPI0039F51AC1
MLRRLVLRLLLAALAGTAARAQTAGAMPDVRGKESVYDDRTKELVVRGDARLVWGEIVLTADEMRYRRETNTVAASGHFILTDGARRLVADQGSYDLTSNTLHVHNLRVGEFPVYLTGESVDGTFEKLVFTNATIFFRENAAYAPSIRARKVVYEKGQIVAGEGLQLGLLGSHFVSLPTFQHEIGTELFSYFVGKVGYRRSLGPFLEADGRIPVAPGVKAGADLGLYGSRGVMAGPAATYRLGGDNDYAVGGLASGFINDHGDRKTDLLGRPVPENRGFVEWWHRQRIGEHFTLDGQFNYWSDSEVLRDFRPKRFFPVQQPDSYLEGTYAGENYLLSAFARVHPNRYHQVQERLPEIRFDLLPSAAPAGFYQRASASLAVLEEDAYLNRPQQRSTRYDAYYGLERPIALAPWMTFTPVAGGRLTRYADAVNGKDTYTRAIGEVGFDARLRAAGTFDYKNPLWEIDGLRHLVEPRLSYRYAPEADSGARYIPAIDRRVFSTYLQPLSIGDQSNVDDLAAMNTVRLALNNTLQTRGANGGSRDLAALNFAADYRFERPAGQRPLTDLHTELALTPADWIRFSVYERFTPQTSAQQELNYALELTDQEWWAAKLSSHFLRDDYEEYALDYRQRVNEVFDVVGRWRYDVRHSRFNEQTYGISQRLGQTWSIKYEVSFSEGPRRESNFGFNLEVELLKF